jgi:hypothetical protein
VSAHGAHLPEVIYFSPRSDIGMATAGGRRLDWAVMDSPRPFKLTVVFWIGLVLLVLGTGPLLLIVVAAELGLTSDPNPNPIGPGLLAFFTFWPAVILIVWGLVASVLRYRKQTG